jgi:hypothetical protein
MDEFGARHGAEAVRTDEAASRQVAEAVQTDEFSLLVLTHSSPFALRETTSWI